MWAIGVGWRNAENGEPSCIAQQRERFLLKRRRYERSRYWDPETRVRKRRLERSAREGDRPRRPVQLTLDDVAGDCVQTIQKEAGTMNKSLPTTEQ